MSDYPCDQFDCPLHPVYVEEERRKKEEQKKEQETAIANGIFKIGDNSITISNDKMYIYSSSISNNIISCDTMYNINSIEPETRIHVPLVGNIHFSCLMCMYLKRVDMKEKIIIDNAKNLLSKK